MNGWTNGWMARWIKIESKDEIWIDGKVVNHCHYAYPYCYYCFHYHQYY